MLYVKAQSKYDKWLEVYQIFGGSPNDVNYSEDSKQESFIWESQGIGDKKSGLFSNDNKKPNGYILGKKWMEVTVKMWKQDIKDGLLFKHELYEEGKYPKWWLDKIL